MDFGANAMRAGTRCVVKVLTPRPTTAISCSPGTSGLSAFRRDGHMTGTTRSSDGLDERRKRLLFHCWHRGTREMDLILGLFADAEIAGLDDVEVAQLEALISLEDPDLYPAFVGETQLPPEYVTPLFERIKSFRNLDLLAPGRALTFSNVADGAEGLIVSDLARAAQNDFKAARKAYERAVKLKPEDIDTRRELALTLIRLGETDKAK
eukprot:gene54748-75021_t